MDIDAPGPAASARFERLAGYAAQDPGNRMLAADLFDAALAAGQFDAAEQVLARVRAADPDDPAGTGWSVRLALARGQFELARQGLLQLQQRDGAQPALLLDLAYVALRQQDWQGALDLLAGAPELGQLFPRSAVLQARCQHQLGQLAPARAVLAAYLERAADDAEAQGLAALLAFDAMALPAARRHCAAALALDPDAIDALTTSGWLALDDGRPDAARGPLGRVLELDPGAGRAWLGLGLVEMLARRIDLALPLVERAAAAMPRHEGTLITQAWCQMLGGQFGAAEATLAAAMQLNRNFAETHGTLALLHLMLERPAQAAPAARRALRLNPLSLTGRQAQAFLDGSITDLRSLQALNGVLLARPAPASDSLSPL